MKVLAANVEDVMREAAARWTLVAYFLLSSMFVLIFAFAVNLDIVQGTLSGAKLFGKSLEIHGSSVSIQELVLSFETGFSGILYFLAVLLAVFATAHLVPRMQDKGTVDLYLSRPVGRVKLLLCRYVAGLILAGSNIVYLIGAMWLIVIWKTHVVHPRFMLAAVIIFFMVATLLAFAFLIGVATSSTAVSIMSTYALFLFGLILAAHDHFAAVVSRSWEASLIQTLYWVFPKSWELFGAVITFVYDKTLPGTFANALTPPPFLSTAAFAVACLALASWLFQRKEF